MRSLFRKITRLAFFMGFGYALWRALSARKAERDLQWSPETDFTATNGRANRALVPSVLEPTSLASSVPPELPENRSAKSVAAIPATPPRRNWTESSDGSAPRGYPIKVTKGSKVYRAPGDPSYADVIAHHCYRNSESAEADGLTRARR